MKASKSTISKKDILICMVEEYAEQGKEAFDCTITSIDDDSVDVLYLSGYKSRNDTVPFSDVVAKVDLKQPVSLVADGIFKGHFLVFDA